MKPLLIVALLAATPVLADPPLIETALISQTGLTWRVDVTLTHPDTGWDHYADGWEILSPDGTRLGFRKLLHPHVNEQPFTRSLSGVTLPSDLAEVRIRAHCLIDGWATDTYGVAVRR